MEGHPHEDAPKLLSLFKRIFYQLTLNFGNIFLAYVSMNKLTILWIYYLVQIWFTMGIMDKSLDGTYIIAQDHSTITEPLPIEHDTNKESRSS